MKKYHWFRPWGIGHLPVSWPGWVIESLVIIFLLQTFLAIDRASHSVSDTFFGFYPYLVSTLLLKEWVASKTSK